jgi:hypothetical protein
MKKSDRADFAEIVLGFAELKGRSLSAPAIELYWRAMQSWSIEEFRAAAAQLLTTCEWMPTPKEFADLRKAGRDTAGEAWARARAACGTCRSGGHYGSGGTCGDEFIDRVVRAIGGYRAIALSEIDKLHFLERRFAEHFETMRDAQEVREALPQIAGRAPTLALAETRATRESFSQRRLGGPAR